MTRIFARTLGAAVAVTAVTVSGAAGQARWIEIPIGDVRVLSDGAGAARVLLDPGDLSGLSGLFVESAALVVPLDGGALSREVDVRVHPVTRSWRGGAVSWTTPWERPGGDFDEGRYGATRLPSDIALRELELDVTGIVREIAEGEAPSEGLLLTVAAFEGAGFGAEELERLGGLQGLALAVKVRPAPRRGAG